MDKPDQRKTLIAALPARKNERSNPFQYLLYQALEPLGYEADEFERAVFRLPRVGVVHLHWPDGAVLHASRTKTLWRLFIFFSILSLYKLRRIPVVWTAHNAASHDGYHPRLEALLWTLLCPLLDAVICLKPLDAEPALRRYPALRSKVLRHIPHGEFGTYYRTVGQFFRPKAESLAHPSPPPSPITHHPSSIASPPPRRFLLFGLVRTYKRIPETIQAFRKHADPHARLLIAGRSLESALSKEISNMAALDSRVEFQDRFIEPEQVAELFESVDALVLAADPAKNSGILHLAASFGLPVVYADRKAPNWEAPATLPPPPAWPELAAAHAELFRALAI
jgi:beta-1,4-mannosyltransferase